MPRDFYDLLGVSQEATSDEVKAAYRAKAREFHPDVNPDERAGAQFKTVRRAYEVLSDETERAAYDRLGHQRYVSERMEGLPTADTGTGREDSRWDRGDARSRRRADRSGGEAGGGGSKTGTGPGAGSDSESVGSASVSSSASATADRGGRSRDAPGASTRTRSRRDPLDARRRVSPLSVAWGTVLTVGGLYLVGLAQYARANAAAASSLADALASNPAGAVTAVHGLSSPAAFAASAAAAGSLGLLFPVGAALLVVAFGGVIYRFGHGAAWLYAVAAAAPAVGLLASASLPTASGVFFLVFLVLPVGATLAFALDVGRYLLAT